MKEKDMKFADYTTLHKGDIKRLREFLELSGVGGCLKASSWTSGSYSHIKRRALPAFVREYVTGNMFKEGVSLPPKVYYFLQKNPRVQKVLFIDEQEALRGIRELRSVGKDELADELYEMLSWYGVFE